MNFTSKLFSESDKIVLTGMPLYNYLIRENSICNKPYSIVEELCGVKSNLNLDPVLVSGIENEPWIEANIENFIIV